MALPLVWFGMVGVPAAQARSAVLVGAGDISDCRNWGDTVTAGLLRSIGGTVFTLGDNAYDDATYKQFKVCYGPTWGRFMTYSRESRTFDLPSARYRRVCIVASEESPARQWVSFFRRSMPTLVAAGGLHVCTPPYDRVRVAVVTLS